MKKVIRDAEKNAAEVEAILRRLLTDDQRKSFGLNDDVPSRHRKTTGGSEPPVENLPNPINNYDDCPAVWRTHIDAELTVIQIAKMVRRKPKSIKTHHKQKWGPPIHDSAGSIGAVWKLRDIFRALLNQFPGKSYKAPETLN